TMVTMVTMVTMQRRRPDVNGGMVVVQNERGKSLSRMHYMEIVYTTTKFAQSGNRCQTLAYALLNTDRSRFPASLFVSEGSNRIDAKRMLGRQHGRQSRADDDGRCRRSETQQVNRGCGVQQRLNSTTDADSGHRADGETDSDRTERLSDDQADHLRGARAECDANPDFVGLRSHDVPNHSEHANTRQQQGKDREASDEQHQKAPWRKRFGDGALQWPDARDSDRRVGGFESLHDGGNETRCRKRG